MDMRFSLLFLLRVWGTQTPSLPTFIIFFKWWQVVDWNVLILKYFRVDCTQPILLKLLDRVPMSVLVWVHLSMRYRQTKFWKPVSDLAVSNDSLALNSRNFFCCFCVVFVIIKLSHYMPDRHFQFLHFRGMRLLIKLLSTLFHYWNKNDQWRHFNPIISSWV